MMKPRSYTGSQFVETKLTRALGVALSAAVLLSATGCVAFAAGIVGSKHDLSSGGASQISAIAGSPEDKVCAFCHTPHGANSSIAPLWNKGTNSTVYTMYGTTVAGNNPEGSPNGVTKACLSCHDGVNAMNSLRNAPGSGNFNASGQNVQMQGISAGQAATMTGTPVPVLGTDLTDDHPVSITYTEGDASLKPTTDTLTGWQGADTIADLLRAGFVECVSCHDPHRGDVETFLRVENFQSALCLSCHDK